jgi:hypothetical protein
MARIRTIKPGFFRHADLFDAEAKHGFPLRLAFAGLWTAADREGRFEWNPRALKLDCLPYDDVDFSKVLNALAEEGFLIKYKVGARTYGCIPSWSKHQQVNSRETASSIPAHDEDSASTCMHTPEPVQDRGEGKGREQEGKGTETATQTEKVPSVQVSESQSPLELKKEMFSRGVNYLTTCGLSQADARSMLGKWRRDHGEVATVMALATAEGAAVSEPIPYIQAILRGNKNGKQQGKQPLSDHPLGIFGELGDEIAEADEGTRGADYAKAVN